MLWAYSLFFVPTFDLDESLYRRVAQEIKMAHLWWTPTWDALPLYHKPPFFYWIIAGISQLVDGPTETVSIFASRLPSFLACVGILYALYRETRTLTASLLWCAALLPLITATAVIFDPIQTLLFLPALFIPTRLFIEERKPNLKEITMWVFSLFTATAWKGLNGILIPTFAYGLHLLLQCLGRRLTARALFLEVFSFTIKIFLPAAALSFIF